MPTFEFDAEKSAANRAKHGIDFVEAQQVWTDTRSIEFAARSDTEPRLGQIGLIEGKLWTVFFTMRKDAIRIFSARRARQAEARLYDPQIH